VGGGRHGVAVSIGGSGDADGGRWDGKGSAGGKVDTGGGGFIGGGGIGGGGGAALVLQNIGGMGSLTALAANGTVLKSFDTARPDRSYPPRHPTHLESSMFDGILRRGQQDLEGPTLATLSTLSHALCSLIY
jgi:hypothetical protein